MTSNSDFDNKTFKGKDFFNNAKSKRYKSCRGVATIANIKKKKESVQEKLILTSN